jgi:hypothetical protein
MVNVLLASGILIGVIVLFAVYRFLKVSRQNRKLNRLRFERIQPLYDKLESGQAIDREEVAAFAADIRTRQLAYELLKNYNKSEFFPSEYYTLIKGAEGQLASWLEFPTELDACPDEMEHIKRVTIDFDGQGNFVHYEVFKYRTNEPHWAAKDGWILGVVGPYFDDSQPFHHAGATFSRISSTADKISPEEEARWVHEHISMRRR